MLVQLCILTGFTSDFKFGSLLQTFLIKLQLALKLRFGWLSGLSFASLAVFIITLGDSILIENIPSDTRIAADTIWIAF